LNIVFLSFTTFLFSCISLKILSPLAHDIGLVDKPGHRKLHKGDIPLIGGISIFISILFASSIFIPDSVEFRMYLIASALIVFIGAIDDRYDLSVRVRIVGQILVASIMIYGLGLYIKDFGDIFGFGNFSIYYFGVIFTYLSTLVLINAYNMIDGIDGLLGCQSIVTLSSLIVLFYVNQSTSVSYPIMLCVAIFPYLLSNLGVLSDQFKKVYMGDAGSMFIGLSILWMLSKGTQGEDAIFNPVTALWITAIPLMDMLAIILRRLQEGHSPFKPDRRHLHHICLKLGLTSSQTLVAITFLSTVLSSIGIVGELYSWPESVMLWSFILLFLIYNQILKYVNLQVNLKN